MLSSAAALVLVFALLAAFLWCARRMGGGESRARMLGLIDSVPLGANRSVTIVRSQGRYFLLGATPQSITLIAELEAEKFKPCEDSEAAPTLVARVRAMRAAR